MRAVIVGMTATCIALSAQCISAAQVSDLDLAVSAIEGYIRTANSEERIERVRAARDALNERAAASPDQVGAAAMFFTRGLTAEEVDAMASRDGLEVFSAELKVVAGQDQRVFTIFLGGSDLLAVPGSLGDRIRIATGHYRAEFAELAKHSPPNESTRYRELAVNRSIRCYRVDVIGKLSAIQSKLGNPSVSAIMLRDSPDLLEGHRTLKRAIEEKRAGSRVVIKGPPPSEGAQLKGYTLVPPTGTPVSEP